MACLWKQHWSYWCNPTYTAVRFIFTMFIELVFGTMFWDLGTKVSKSQDLFNVMGSMYVVVLFLGIQNTSSVQPVVDVERTVFYRERAAKIYSAIPYAFGQNDVSHRSDFYFFSRGAEKATLMELLNFMYSNTLTTNTAPALLDVLIATDKFEVASCMRFQEEVMKLPLAGIEGILSSDDLQVASEDALYDFLLKWTRAHYPLIDECQEILSSRLGRCIHFYFMICQKLQKVLTCNDFEHDFASKLVVEALFYKDEVPHRQQTQAVE
ncbi:BTB/POZ domain-containing protein POB1 [Capsicum baccatum]|uniref:BTB/POZ domain-containing protein POB1 n=1 Tax=Capsicum baccatum TaxID=33114 RepID=A0A2G2VCK8_CAPBA|nr:BTB/POZ domain-containing protein POB1 [Capsicum baccatum]